MRVKYVGPLESVEVPAAEVVVERGATVDVPDDIGASLCESDDWEAAKTSSRSKTEE